MTIMCFLRHERHVAVPRWAARGRVLGSVHSTTMDAPCTSHHPAHPAERTYRRKHAYDPSMDGESRRSRTRSFLVGAAVGASAAIAAARRLRPKDRKRETPAGLAAFEEAPCYRELVESERLAP